MGKTKIEWVQNPDGSRGESWNPFRGVKGKWHCTKVSDGCKNCYAERLNLRFSGLPYTVGADTIVLDQKILQQPLHWRKPRMVFAPTMTDPFHETITEPMLRDFFFVMAQARQHEFQVLTKRIARARDVIRHWYDIGLTLREGFTRQPLPNVWLGVSVEDQSQDWRIRALLDTPAAIRFVSYEPALGPVDFSDYIPDQELSAQEMKVVNGGGYAANLDWIIFGGESGPGKRFVDPQWARNTRDQCKAAGVAFFMKQLDKKQPIPDDLMIREFPRTA